MAQDPRSLRKPVAIQNRSARCRCSSSDRWSCSRSGYQLHFSINSSPFFLRFAKPDDLQWLMPVFWIGFNIAMFSGQRRGQASRRTDLMGAAGLLGALAVLGAELAGNLNMLIAAQFVAGAAWGCMLMMRGRGRAGDRDTGAEGKVVGWCSRALALATFARMARSRAACRSCRNTRRCCNGRRWRAGRSPAPACCDRGVAGAGEHADAEGPDVIPGRASARNLRCAIRIGESRAITSGFRVRCLHRPGMTVNNLRLRRVNERPGVVSESVGTSMSIKVTAAVRQAFSSAARK